MSTTGEDILIGRCYTKARRHPSMIGQWEGRRLWGGPYTVPQFITIGTVFGALVLLLLTVPALWATFGLFNLAALVVLPYLASLLVRRLHIDGRNPFSAMASATGLLTGGQRPHLHGRQLRHLTAHPLQGTATVTEHLPQRSTTAEPQQAPPPRPARRPSAPTPAPAGRPASPAASALAQLAAHRTTSRQGTQS
ncbi:phage holin family protein [Streptomyces sp. NPDC057694]|uniref:phage holin family protein n=1 Tax=Streptomyces sp. NPDC057694 TaxID=3346216 RepID=UPI00369587BB